MFRCTSAAVCAIAGVFGIASPAIAQDPAVVGKGIYKQVLDNDKVRVFEVTFKPGAKIDMHSHPDHVAYVVTPGKLNITGKDGKTDAFDLKTGMAVFLPAQAHSANNPGKTMVKLVVTELKDAKK